jgi:transcriptional regulator with XRE-family HTH domain
MDLCKPSSERGESSQTTSVPNLPTSLLSRTRLGSLCGPSTREKAPEHPEQLEGLSGPPHQRVSKTWRTIMDPSEHDAQVASWSPEKRRDYERSLLRLTVAGRIENLLVDLEVPKSELAGRIRKSRAWVSKLLSGRQNLTLDTLAEIGWALGVRWEATPVAVARNNTPAARDPTPPSWVQRDISQGSSYSTAIEAAGPTYRVSGVAGLGLGKGWIAQDPGFGPHTIGFYVINATAFPAEIKATVFPATELRTYHISMGVDPRPETETREEVQLQASGTIDFRSTPERTG